MTDDQNEIQTPLGQPSAPDPIAPPPPPAGLFPEQPGSPAAPAPAAPAVVAPVAPPVTPQAPVAQAAYQQPVVTGAPKKRSTTRLIITVVVGIVLLCGLLTCAALLLGGLGNDDKAIALAESHFTAAESAVASASAALEDTGDTAQVDAALIEAEKSVRIGRDELAAARAAIESLDDSEGKTLYLDSLTEATTALDGLEDLLAYLGTANDMAAKVEAASNLASKAMDDLNDAVSHANSDNYTAMKREATAASTGFARAAAAFREAHNLDKSAGFDKSVAYCDARKRQADLAIRMAGEGKAGKMSAYNKSIDRMDAISDQAEKIGEPAILDDADWTDKRLQDISDTVEKAGARTDELHAKALQELGYSD